MSVSSFPRPEHAAALRKKIDERLTAASLTADVAELALNHYKCQYQFGIRRSPDREWRVLAIHFQYAERFFASGNDSELSSIVDRFLNDIYAG